MYRAYKRVNLKLSMKMFRRYMENELWYKLGIMKIMLSLDDFIAIF